MLPPLPSSSRAEFQEDTFSGGQYLSQPVDAPQVTENATIISSWHDVSIREPPESFEAGDSVEDLPGQSADPNTEDEDSSDDASTVTPIPQARKRKKRKWYKRIIDRVLRRRSSQQASASMRDLPGYGVSQ